MSLRHPPRSQAQRGPRAARKLAGDRRRRLRCERLESRELLAIDLSYGGPGTALQLNDFLGSADDVSVTTAGTVLRVDLNGATFGGSSTVAAPGLAYEVAGDPAASNWADITIANPGDIADLTINSGGGNDTLSVSVTSANVGGVQVDGQMGDDTIVLPGNLTPGGFFADLTAETIELQGTVNLAAPGSAVNFNGPVELTGAATVTAEFITFGDTVDGPHNLTVQPAFIATFFAPVGATTPLGSAVGTDSLVIDSGFTDFFSTVETAGNFVQTTGSLEVHFLDNVTVGGNLDLQSMVRVDFGITPVVWEVAGNVSVGTSAFDFLTVNDRELFIDTSSAGSNITLHSSTDLSLDGSLRADAGAGTINVLGPIDAEPAADLESVTLIANGAVTGSVLVNAPIGGFGPVSAVTIDAGYVEIGANITTNDGPIEVDALDDVLVVDGIVVDSQAGTIDFQAAGDITLGGQLTTVNSTSAAVSVVSTGGSVLDGGDAAGDDIIAVTSGAVVTISGDAGVGTALNALDIDALTADLAANIGLIHVVDTAGGLLVSSATTNDGNITLVAQGGTLSLDAVSAGGTGNVHATADDQIEVGDVSALGDDVTLVATTSIVELVVDAAADVTSMNLIATAATGIDLDTDIDNLSAINTTSGAIEIDETNGINFTTLENPTPFAGSNVRVHATLGDITQTAPMNVAGNVAFMAFAGETLLFDAGNQIGGEITLTSAGDAEIRDSLGDMVFNSTTVGGNLLAQSEGGDIEQVGVFNVTGASSFTTTLADADILLDSLTPTNDFVGPVSLFTNGTTGQASVSDVNTLDIGLSNVGGDLLAIAQGGDLVSSDTAMAGGTVDFQSLTAAIVDANGAALNVDANHFSGTAATGIGAVGDALEIDVNTTDLTVTAAGLINVQDVAGGVIVNSATTFDGDILLEALGGDLTLLSVIAGGSGDVLASTVGSGDILADDVQALGNTITLNSVAAIEELGADGASDLSADLLQLTAVSGIGALAQLEIDGGDTLGTGLTALVTGAGIINLRDVNGLRVNSAATTDGDITLEAASGNLTLISVVAGGGGNVNAATLGGSGVIEVDSVTATADRVTLDAFTSINDINAGATNIAAAGAELIANDGIGSGDALEVDVATLAAANAGGANNIEVTGVSGALLTIGAVGATSGVNNHGAGAVIVTNNSGITVAADSSAGTAGFTLTALESAAAGEDIVILSGVTVQSDDFIDLSAGDNFVVEGTPGQPVDAVLDAVGSVTFDSLDTAADALGSTFDFFGNVNAANIAFNGANQIDIFNIKIDDNTHMDVDGKLPSFPTLPGDQLNVFGVNLTLTLTGIGAGSWTGPGVVGLDYIEIETVTASSPYHLIVDMGAPGFVPYDSIDAQLSTPNTHLELRVDVDDDARDGVLAFNGPIDNIRSLAVLGSADGEVFSITHNANDLLPGDKTLPPATRGLNDSSPIGQPLNATFLFDGRTPDVADPPSIHFTGGAGGGDLLRLNLNTAEDLGYYADDLGGPGSGNINVQGKMTVSFNTSERVDFNQAVTGGSIVVDSSSFADLTSMVITDLGAASEVDGDAGFADVEFNGVTTVLVRSGLGQDLIDLVSIDASGLTSVTLDGDTAQDSDINNPAGNTTADDTLRIRSLPANVPATMLGGAGRDLFQLFDAGNTVNNILSQVSVLGEDGNGAVLADDSDRLVIVDSGDNVGTTVDVTETSVDGLTGLGAGLDVIYSDIDHLDVTATSGMDHVYVDMANGISDLNTATVRGDEGQDLFDVLGVENFVPSVPALQRFTDLFLVGDGPGLANEGDIFGADQRIQSSLSVVINIDGGVPSPAANAGNILGDRLNLDMANGGTPQTQVLATTTLPVLVDTVGGLASSASHADIRFVDIEWVDLIDLDGQTTVERGDLYVRSSESGDRVSLYRDLNYATLNTVRLRYNATDMGPLFQTTATILTKGTWIVYGRDGNDQITVNNGVERDTEMYGQQGNDYLTGSFTGGVDMLVGGSGNDRLQGLDGHDVLWGDRRPGMPETLNDLGLDGIDQLNGGDGNDVLDAGGHNDRVYGENDDDIIRGGEGNDTLNGGNGVDIMLGGDGRDQMNGSYDRDLLIGGLGIDFVDGDQEQDIVIGDASVWDDDPTNDAALLALMFGPAAPGDDFWTSGNSYNVRTASGGNLQLALLAGISDDGDIDTLVGDADLDWYFDVLVSNDKYSGKLATEKVN